ncbi:flagellar biosynthesis protein FlgA [Nonomuraea deserti]|uniref:Flagellar biosynthesis protein FlgA n=1 Tax=Nonomuraea deserti TaxID=1848322 RepID=A0A4R4V749_9ACTN|nr:RcpC/CpaB family pilus assembly protein [Nonomuraea deserti]TDD00501.1 flagellar biosynthesis protein FlgA [Nonomuraea deserti]
MIQTWLSRYARRRRLIAAALAAVAVLSAYLATRPAAGPTVLVAARDLSPGPLDPDDFSPVPLAHPPSGAVRATRTGQILATPMRKGEPLTDVRLLRTFRLPPGMVAAPVRIADAAAVELISPGSTIGVLASWQEGQPARQIASALTVLTIPATTRDSGHDHGALIVLATTPTQAAELAAAQAGGRLSITINPAGGP